MGVARTPNGIAMVGRGGTPSRARISAEGVWQLLCWGWFGGREHEALNSPCSSPTRSHPTPCRAAVYPDDTADAMWLNSAPYRTYPNGGER